MTNLRTRNHSALLGIGNYSLLLLLALLLIGSVLSQPSAIAQNNPPQPPHIFFGTVRLDVAPVADGTTVSIQVTHSATETHTLTTAVFSRWRTKGPL